MSPISCARRVSGQEVEHDRTQSHHRLDRGRVGKAGGLRGCRTFFGGCTSNVDGFSPVEPGGTRPATALQYSILEASAPKPSTGEVPVEGAEVVIARDRAAIRRLPMPMAALLSRASRLAVGASPFRRMATALSPPKWNSMTRRASTSLPAAEDAPSLEAKSENCLKGCPGDGGGPRIRDHGTAICRWPPIASRRFDRGRFSAPGSLPNIPPSRHLN